MKKIIKLLAVTSVIAITSCKKEYICTCVFPFEGQEPYVQEYIAKTYNKKNAKEKCDLQEHLSTVSNTKCTIE